MKDYQAIYESRIIPVAEAISKIESGEIVGVAGSGNLPSTLLENMHLLKEYGKEDVTIFHGSGPIRGKFPYLVDPQYKGTVKVHATFYNNITREVQKNGVVTHFPYQVYRAHKLHKIDTFITTCTPPDKHGYVRMSLSCLGEGVIWRSASKIICEVNPNFPYTYGDITIPVEKVDYFVDGTRPLILYPEIPLTDVELKIGQNVADLVDDGSTIQLGIGGIPNAVAEAFKGKKDLGVHSEMITTNMARLTEMGVITGRRKTINREKIIGAFALGTQELYDFIDENPTVLILDGNYVNNPFVVAQNYKMCSVNAALQVDLTGQVASESIGPIQYTGIGGAMNMAQGAHYAEEGKAIVAIKSTAKKGTVSTIQPFLTPGAIVSIPRSIVDFIVTEYGVAEMNNRSIQDRVRGLIDIAHPDFREELEKQAVELGITCW